MALHYKTIAKGQGDHFGEIMANDKITLKEQESAEVTNS